MKKLAGLVAVMGMLMLAGCATTGTTGEVAAESGGDGAIKQRVEFRDLSAWEQSVITHGGGGE